MVKRPWSPPDPALKVITLPAVPGHSLQGDRLTHVRPRAITPYRACRRFIVTEIKGELAGADNAPACDICRRNDPFQAASCRNTYCRMPPFLKYSSSSSVSMRQISGTCLTVPSGHRNFCDQFLARPQICVHTADSDLSRRLSVRATATTAFLEHQWQHAHADEIGAMDALKTLRDHRADAEQNRALGGPVARRSGAVFLARETPRAARSPACSASPRHRSASAGRRDNGW